MATKINYLRDHKGIRASLEHLVGRDRYFQKYFVADDIDQILHAHRPCSYEAFARTIVGQQISTKAAASVWARVQAVATPFTPANVLKLPDETLRSAGLSGQKVAYLRGLSEAVQSGAFDPALLDAMDDEEVIASITALKGFGRWSAEMVLMFALTRLDVFSGGDLGLREGLKRVLRLAERPTEGESVVLAQRWAGHRTAASLLLWHTYHKLPPLKATAPKDRTQPKKGAGVGKTSNRKQKARAKTAIKRARKQS